ncbi:MAG: hypothetical protein LWY06_17465 [Firmicutes bacterium]|nr:hypothetical protein [Bacillota bacterium]
MIFHPLRVIGLGFNAPELKNKHLQSQEQTGKLDMNAGGMETSFGVPIEIKNKAELKFLYELYNPEAKAKDAAAGSFKEAAGELAFFTTGSMAGQHPWKLYKDEGKMKNFLRMAAGAIKSGGIGAAIGMAALSIFSLPALSVIPIGGSIGIAAGAAIGGTIGAVKGAFTRKKGAEINAFEALARLSNNEPVTFQEKKKREIGISVPFPVNVQLGSISFYSDHGEGSVLSSFNDLKLFHDMEAQQIQQPDPAKKQV